MNKNSFLITSFILVLLQCRSQSFVTIDGSQVFSTFKFTNSAGKVDENYSSVSSGGYSLGYRAYQSASRGARRFGAFFGRFNVGMRKGGATLAYNTSNITWSLQYCDFRLGCGYEIDKWRLKPFVSIAGYYSLLLKGYQSMDGQTYDIKANKTFKKNDAGVLAIPGLKVYISDYISLYTEFTYLIGLQNLETSGKQKLNNKGYLVTLGLAATLTKSKPKWLQGRR